MDSKRKVVEDYLIENGFYLNDGIKYGLDFLVYTDHPDKVHSKYGVVVDQMNFKQLCSCQRICTSNNKILIVAIVNEDESIQLVQCKRFEMNKVNEIVETDNQILKKQKLE